MLKLKNIAADVLFIKICLLAVFTGSCRDLLHNEDAKTGQVYTVTVNPSEHGTVNPSAASAGEKTTVTLTVSPEAGYQLKSLTVKDAANADVTVSGTGTSRSFTMPASNVTVSAEFEPLPVYSVTFHANGGSPAPESQNVTEGGSVTEPADMTKTPSAGLYQAELAALGVFGGWYADAEYTT